eukprot:363994-Chlamydomonas_euryale.AAC.7
MLAAMQTSAHHHKPGPSAPCAARELPVPHLDVLLQLLELLAWARKRNAAIPGPSLKLGATRKLHQAKRRLPGLASRQRHIAVSLFCDLEAQEVGPHGRRRRADKECIGARRECLPHKRGEQGGAETSLA